MAQVPHFFVVESVPDDAVVSLGRALKRARKASGLDLRAFAAALTASTGFPVSADLLIHAEQGRADLPASVLIHAARVSGATLSALLGDSDRIRGLAEIESDVKDLVEMARTLALPN